MADEFVTVPIESDTQTLADNAIAQLRTTWPDWTPNDGDLEVIQIEALAPMAQNAAETASRVPAAIFRRYGTDLIGIPYTQGTPALTTTTWTLVSNPAGRTIPADTQIAIDGFAFAVELTQIVPAATLVVAGITMAATENGVAANDLTGVSVSMISALDWVESITVDATTAGGADEENDVVYQDRLSRELQLQAKTLVTTRDFELMGLSVAGVGRLVAFNDGERNVLVVGTDLVGEPLSAPIKALLVDLYEAYRQVNTVVTVDDATYTTIGVTYTVKAYPGYDATDLEARIDVVLSDVLDPNEWGRPKGFGDPGTQGWFNETVVRKNKLIDLIGDVEGVDYVDTLTLTGSAGSADAGGNWLLPGTVSLTRVGTLTGTIT